MMENLEIYEKAREVPETAKRDIKGGRLSGKTDINPMWRIKKLTELFGPIGIGWYYKPVKEWKETVGEEIAVFVDIELYIKHDGEWSMPIHGTGGNMLAEKERSGLHISDECYKMATTDAISVACKQLGIGADVYWETDATKYDEDPGKQSDQKSRLAPEITPEQKEREEIISQITAELKRTGRGKSAVLRTYNASNINDMTKLQLKDCLGRLKRMESAGKAVG